jgi:hypothetical protein
MMFILALTTLFYAVPRLPMHNADPLAKGFAIVWLSFALVVVASQLYQWIGVDREAEEAYRRVQRIKRWKMQQQVLRMSRVRSGIDAS